MEQEKSMRIKDKDTVVISPEQEENIGDKRKAVTILSMVALTVVVVAFYYFSLAFDFFPIVMWGYMISLAVLVLVYIFYNRGFSRKGVTPEMLPDEWSDEKKRDFIYDGQRRMKKSKWILALIIAFVTTFLVEALILFVAPMFSGWF